MEHIAILSKKRKILDKIISGEKTIESRWYKFKKAPFETISAGETVYFKESGEMISAKAKVKKTLFFKDLNLEKIKEILTAHGKDICMNISQAETIKDKKFCTLIFLEDVKKIEPFAINKKGYGVMTAWISLDDVGKIKKMPNASR